MMSQPVVVDVGPASIRLESTSMHLASRDLGSLIVRGATRESRTGDELRAPSGTPIATLKFFTIPAHVLEDLWVTEIPRVVGSPPAIAGTASGGSSSIETMLYLIETADREFVGPMQVTFHVRPTPSAPAIDDVCADVWKDPGGSLARRCAWLNLDAEPQIARVVPRSRGAGGGQDADLVVLDLKIPEGEGILWNPMELRVGETSGDQLQVKALITAG
jgi:hypothetical protein